MDTPQPHAPSIQSVRLSKRNASKQNTAKTRPVDASPAPASTATATAPSSPPPSPIIRWLNGVGRTPSGARWTDDVEEHDYPMKRFWWVCSSSGECHCVGSDTHNCCFTRNYGRSRRTSRKTLETTECGAWRRLEAHSNRKGRRPDLVWSILVNSRSSDQVWSSSSRSGLVKTKSRDKVQYCVSYTCTTCTVNPPFSSISM